MNNLTSNTTFICNSAGLYQVTAVIIGKLSGATIHILNNNDRIASFYTAENANGEHHTTTEVAVMALQPGDTIFVKSASSVEIFASDSCLTIIKIK